MSLLSRLSLPKLNLKANFLRWMPAVAIVYGVLAIGGYTAAMTYYSGKWGYVVIGGIALLVLFAYLWQVRKWVPHIFGGKSPYEK